MSDELINNFEEMPASNQGLDSSLSILVAGSAILNIDPGVDTLFTLSELIATTLEQPELDDSNRESIALCRDQLCAILFELESLQLGPIVELPISELQSHLLTLSFGSGTDGALEIGQPVVEQASPLDSAISANNAPPFNSPTALGFWNSGARFAEPLGDTAIPALIPSEISNRLAILLQITAFELESAEFLKPVLEKFWGNRDAAIRPLLASTGGKIGLASAPAAVATEFENKHTALLPDNRLPIATLISSLRHLLAKKGPAPNLGLIDTASLLLFLADAVDAASGFTRSQPAALDGLIVPLIRLNRWKSDALDFLNSNTSQSPIEVETTIRESIELLRTLWGTP